jgi:isopropylmalate/homocitrate/citramalate synthase
MGNLEDAMLLSCFVDKTLNRTPKHTAPYVGASAFAHKGGLHVRAIKRDPNSYQHVYLARVVNRLHMHKQTEWEAEHTGEDEDA